MRYKDLSSKDKKAIKKLYKSYEKKYMAVEILSGVYGVHERTIQKWCQRLGMTKKGKEILGMASGSKVLIYDLETSGVDARVWWTGKQYVGHRQLQGREPKIITVAWKWLGEHEVYSLTWDKEKSDKKMLEEFLLYYNDADVVVGVNSNRFDNRWMNARALKYGLFINTQVRSLDVQKEAKRLFRLPSYSMEYIAKYLNVTLKQSHEGMIMWELIENGTEEEVEIYLSKMVDYNIGDIVTTEEILIKFRPYIKTVSHLGVLNGKERHTCPNCGGDDISLFKKSVTVAGTVQWLMKCNKDGTQFRLSNSNYNKYLENESTTNN